MHSSIDRNTQVQHMFNFSSSRHVHGLSSRNGIKPVLSQIMANNAKEAWSKSNNKHSEIEFQKCRQFAIDHLTYLYNTIDGSMPLFTAPQQMELFAVDNKKRS